MNFLSGYFLLCDSEIHDICIKNMVKHLRDTQPETEIRETEDLHPPRSTLGMEALDTGLVARAGVDRSELI